MKTFLILVLCALAKASTDKELWEAFKSEHGKVYGRMLEETTRFSIFQQNLRKIEAHNENYEAGTVSWKMGVTQFADMTAAEFSQFLSPMNASLLAELDKDTTREVFTGVGVQEPTSIDWRSKGAVTPVKNQGKCGGCWTFSTTGTLEGMYYLKHRQLLSFSEQNLLDCATTNYGGAGCNGGVVQYALNYVKDHGIELESSYPYKAQQGSCQFTESKSVLKASGYVDVARNNENALKAAIGTVGPVSVALNADEFQLYSSGIYDSNTCTNSVNHGVLGVGYGTENGKSYWIIKNSWGSSFGENGYIRMLMGKNLCSLTAQACYAKL